MRYQNNAMEVTQIKLSPIFLSLRSKIKDLWPRGRLGAVVFSYFIWSSCLGV